MRLGSSKAAALCIAAFAFAVTVARAPSARADDAIKEQAVPETAFELTEEGVIVRTGDVEKLVKVGCSPRSFAAQATTAYVLCAPSTVVIVEALPDPHIGVRTVLTERIVSLTVIGGVVSARGESGVKPLADYAVGAPPLPPRETRHATKPVERRAWSPAPRKRRPPPPDIRGLEVDLAGTAGVGVDAQPGAFAFFDTDLVYRFDGAPFSIAAYGTFGAATGSFDLATRATGPLGGDVQVAVGEVLVGVDSRVVAISGGPGAALVEHGSTVAPLVAFRGRFGVIDAFTIAWHASFAVNANSALGALGGAIEFRLSRAWWLGADAELGALRYGRFMVDARHRLSGNGPKGTLDVRAGVGLAFVESSADCQTPIDTRGFQLDTECFGTNTNYLGPAFSLGLVWRP